MTVYSAEAADSLFRPSPSASGTQHYSSAACSTLPSPSWRFSCISFYSKDVNMELCDEWIQWRAFLSQLPSVPTKPSPLQMLQIMKEYNLQSGFPNVCIALRIYLTLPVSNCSGERSFSHLKRIKNALRSTMGQDRLTNLTLMNIECEIVQRLDFQDIVDSFLLWKHVVNSFKFIKLSIL